MTPQEAEQHVVEAPGGKVRRCLGCGCFHFLHTSPDGKTQVVHIADAADLPPGFTAAAGP
jgi:hypothetical protein